MNDTPWKEELNRLGKISKKQAKKMAQQPKTPAKKTEEINFAEAVGKVQPLKDNNRYQVKQEREYIRVRQKEQSQSSDVGIFVGIDEHLEPPKQYTFGGEGKNDIRKLLSGKLEIVSTLDLHGYRQEEAQLVLNEFIDYVRQRGVCAEIIHGSGLGSKGFVPTLKSMVRRWLIAHPQVMAYTEPNAHNDGSVLILLKRNRKDRFYSE